MINDVKEATYILAICSKEYKDRAENITHGVGFETQQISRKLMEEPNRCKTIPIAIYKDETLESVVPYYLKNNYGLSLVEGNKDYIHNFSKLLKALKCETNNKFKKYKQQTLSGENNNEKCKISKMFNRICKMFK